MHPEESRQRGERDARQSREGSGSDLGRVANEKDLRQRTKEFALQIIRLFSEFPKTTEAQYSANRSCDLAHRSERTTGKRIVLAVELNGASGTSDMHGNAARVAGVSREANE